MNIEAQVIDVPTGVQDYRPALYGGVSAVELGVAGVRRVALPVAAPELEQRLVLAYTGASRNSGINNWDVMERRIDGDREVQRRVRADPRHRRRDADGARTRRLEAVGPAHRRRMGEPQGPGARRDHARASTRLLAAARGGRRLAGKVCGAGGGGCLFCLGEPDGCPQSARRLPARAAGSSTFRIETEGLRVETRVTA